MSTLRTAAQAALDALGASQGWLVGHANIACRDDRVRLNGEAITALRAALAEQQAERTLLEQFDLDQSSDYHKGRADGRAAGYEVGYRHATERAQAQQAAPVLYRFRDSESVIAPLAGHDLPVGDWTPLYAAPPARVPLTDEQVMGEFWITPGVHQSITVFKAGVRYAERHHGIAP